MASGHIRQRTRQDGSRAWQARFKGPQTNREHLKTFIRKGDAERWLADRRAAALRGDLLDPGPAPLTFAELAERWRNTWPGRLAPRTADRYDQVLRTHLLPMFGSQAASRITPYAVQEFVNGLALAPGGVRKVHVVLSACLQEAARTGHLRSNPARGARLPRAQHRPMLFLGPDEVQALARACDQVGGPVAGTLVLTAAYSGLRSGELLALRRCDVVGNRLHVTRALKDSRGALSYGPTKTHRGRAVVIPRVVVNRLSDLPAGPSEGLLFAGTRGAPIRQNLFVRRVFRPAVLEAGLPPALRMHDLRHTCVALLIAAGAHALEIKEQLGHASITMTMDRYGHLLPSLADNLAARMDALLDDDDPPALAVAA